MSLGSLKSALAGASPHRKGQMLPVRPPARPPAPRQSPLVDFYQTKAAMGGSLTLNVPAALPLTSARLLPRLLFSCMLSVFINNNKSSDNDG